MHIYINIYRKHRKNRLTKMILAILEINKIPNSAAMSLADHSEFLKTQTKPI